MKFCIHCGHEINDNDMFCSECGKGQSENSINEQKEGRKRNWKPILYVLLAIVIVMGIGEAWKEGGNDEYVKVAQETTPNQWHDITYQEAFESFFSSPTWESKAVGDKQLVEFTGDCIYEADNQPVNAKIVFSITEDNEYYNIDVISLYIDEVRQDEDILFSTIYKIFEEY